LVECFGYIYYKQNQNLTTVIALYKKILVPVDGSENCNNALLEAIKIAKITGGTITTLNVYPRWTTHIVDSKEAIPEILQSEAETILSQTKKMAGAEGFEVQTLMVDGDAVQQIVKTANDGNFDLIVMGARGKSMLKGLILGSVSTGVLKNASRPVLITRCRG
jgi:nucleotide-binding universal stress UspA family protein